MSYVDQRSSLGGSTSPEGAPVQAVHYRTIEVGL